MMSNPVTTLKYVKHTPTYVKGEICRDKHVYIRMSSIDSCVFEGNSSSLRLFCGASIYYFPNIDVLIASDIVARSVKA
jgi:hypothetical protein